MASKTDERDDSTVLDDVFSSSRDRGADSAAPVSAPAPKPESEQTPPDAPAPAKDAKTTEEAPSAEKPQQFRDPDTGRFVPLTELKSEREKRQEAQRLREEAEKRADDFKRQLAERDQYLDRVLARVSPPQPQTTEPQPPPDWILNPEEAAAQLRAESHRAIFETRVALGEEVMRARYPDYDATRDAFIQVAQRDPQLVRAMMTSPNPAGFAYEQGKRVQALSKIGGNLDVDGFEKRIRDEERAKVLEELKAGKGNATPPQRFPGTLADATSAGGQGAVLTDDAMMADLFSSSRKRR